MEGQFEFRTIIKGKVQRIKVNCTFALAKYLTTRGMVEMGIWENSTNRIYL